MENHLEAGILDGLVKGARLGNVGHDDGVQPVFAQVRVGIVDLLGLFLRADGGHDGVAARKQCLEDVSC